MILPWLVAPIALPLAVSLVSSPILPAEYTIAASVPFSMLVARGFVSIPSRLGRLVVALGIVASTALSFQTYFGTVRKDAWRDATAIVGLYAEPGDRVLFYRWFNQYAFDFYNKRTGIDEVGLPIDTLAPSSDEITKAVASSTGGASRLWFMTLLNEPARPSIVDALSKMYVLKEHAQAPHVEVYLSSSARNEPVRWRPLICAILPPVDGVGSQTDVHRPTPRQRQAHRRGIGKRHAPSRDRNREGGGHLPAWRCAGCPSAERSGARRAASSGPLAPRATKPVAGPTGTTLPLRRALTEIYNLTTPSRQLLDLLGLARRLGPRAAARSRQRRTAEALPQRLERSARRARRARGRIASIRLTPSELVDSLRKSLPRLYSIASSQAAHPGQVHLLVVSVRYTIRGRAREGVCSTWLADRWPDGATADMYLQNQQKHFAMPADPATPMIMVGPGTGLAPFRAFVEERRRHRRDGPQLALLRRAASRERLLLRRQTQRLRARRAPAPRRRVLTRPGGEDLRPAPHARAGPRPLGVARGRRGVLRLRRQGAHGRRRRPRAASRSSRPQGGRTPDQANEYVETAQTDEAIQARRVPTATWSPDRSLP